MTCRSWIVKLPCYSVRSSNSSNLFAMLFGQTCISQKVVCICSWINFTIACHASKQARGKRKWLTIISYIQMLRTKYESFAVTFRSSSRTETHRSPSPKGEIQIVLQQWYREYGRIRVSLCWQTFKDITRKISLQAMARRRKYWIVR
jgi:hypothetical protein